MWSIKGVGKILGVKLYFPMPVLDGFRIVYKDGHTENINFNTEKAEDGYLFLFKPPIELKGDEEGVLQVHQSAFDEVLLDVDMLIEPLDDVDAVEITVANKKHARFSLRGKN